MHPNWPDTYIYMAQLAIINNQPEKAWGYLEQGLAKDIKTGFISVKELDSEKDFDEFKKDPKWEILMKKYLPEILKE